MATKKKVENTQEKEVNVSLNLKTISVPIRGISPLIVSRFDTKSQQEIIDKAPGKAKQGKKMRTPEEEYLDSLYLMSDGKTPCFPARGFKAAMVRAAQVVYGCQMVKVRTLFRVIGDDENGDLVKINGTHRMRQDMVRVGTINKTAAPRYRAEFPEWSANLTIQYIADAISEEQIISYLNAAGFTCGVGEWRPEKSNSGSYGLFQVVNS